jgi:hypothetical protein
MIIVVNLEKHMRLRKFRPGERTVVLTTPTVKVVSVTRERCQYRVVEPQPGKRALFLVMFDSFNQVLFDGDDGYALTRWSTSSNDLLVNDGDVRRLTTEDQHYLREAVESFMATVEITT